MTVKIYTTPTCHYCKEVKEFFKKHDVKYSEHDVTKDRDALVYLTTKLRARSVPVIEIDNDFMVGFDEEALEKALKIKK